MRKIRVAIAGAGLIAVRKHIPAWRYNRDKAEVVAVCDLKVENAQKAAALLKGATAYDDLSRMLAREKPDVIDICTPPQTHAAVAIQAMELGCHALIEKPLALNLADCDAMINAARDHGVKACVIHSALFYPPLIKAQQLVARGAIGAFRGMRIMLSTPTSYMTSQKEHWAHNLPGGVLGETGPHAVYMTLAFVNPIRDVFVYAKKLLNYDWASFDDYRIELIGDQGICSVTLAYATQQWVARVEILGEDGILLADLEGMSLVLYRRRELTPVAIACSLLSESCQTVRNLFRNGIQLATGSLASTHEVIVRGFAESVLRGGELPVTLEAGREAVKALTMIIDRLSQTPKERPELAGQTTISGNVNQPVVREMTPKA
jgi:predicted dehydrogenase